MREGRKEGDGSWLPACPRPGGRPSVKATFGIKARPVPLPLVVRITRGEDDRKAAGERDTLLRECKCWPGFLFSEVTHMYDLSYDLFEGK